MAGHTGAERWRRVGTTGQVVALGAALCVIAHLSGDHGWLLVAVAAAAITVVRLVRAVGERRRVTAR